MDNRLRSQKPLKMFIYQPVYLNKKYECCTITKFPYFRAEVGDVFTSEKRPADYIKMRKQVEFKVVTVRYNLREGACIVFLEDKVFSNKKELKRFVSDNSRA